ncbi:MAG: 3'-5' exonuclease, partial [Spirochaetota bacterium]
LARFVQEVIELSGYTASLKKDNSLESRSRLENLDEFINSIFEYQELNPDATVDQFIQEISLLTTSEQPEPEDLPLETVSLMTVHNAKGLEFPVVFLTGLEEGLFPHVNSSDSEEGIEEERRLCYVGITRAKDRVYLTNAHQRRVYGNTQDKLPSSFLNEIPPELLKTTTHGPQENSVSYNAAPAWGRNSIHEKRVPRESAPSPGQAISDSQYSVNQRIMHPRYGTGKIVEIQGKGDNVKLTIRFSSGGSKSFLEKHTPLERI